MLWHLITGEYPPQPGGVADYTRLVANGLVGAGDEVHVWSSPDSRPATVDPGIVVHRLPDRFGRNGLRELEAGLRRLHKGRVVVQYVPHMYGYRAMNIAFASWLRLRAPRYWVMFHEVTFPVSINQKLTHNVLGVVNHVMASLVAHGAERIFVTVPRWKKILESRCFIRRPIQWLPVPSNMPTAVDAAAVQFVRNALLPHKDGLLLGHFGTFDARTAPFLIDAAARLLRVDERRRAVLMGRGAEAFAPIVADTAADLRERIAWRGDLSDRAVAEHVAACDILLQPYLDGISSRRSSVMAALALGRPIVTNLGPSTESLWREHALVAAAAPADSNDFVGRAEGLLSSADERERQGRRGRLGYDAYFGLPKIVATLRGQD